VIRIAITAAAFEAITRTLPLGSVAVEPEANAKGQRLVWLDPVIVDRLAAMRGPGEDYSDVILRLANISRGRLDPPASPHRLTLARRVSLRRRPHRMRSLRPGRALCPRPLDRTLRRRRAGPSSDGAVKPRDGDERNAALNDLLVARYCGNPFGGKASSLVQRASANTRVR
jgi:hypothetical protein